MSESFDGPLKNIEVDTTTLAEYLPNISDYLLTDAGQSNFDSFEKIVKRKTFREICKKMGYDPLDVGADIYQKIKESDRTNNIRDRIHYDIVSEILVANGLLELAEIYSNKANAIPLEFYIDEDGDGIEESERTTVKTKTFGR